MSKEKKEEISAVQMNAIVKENPKTKVKSYLTLIILILVMIGLVFFMGTIIPEFFVLLIFLLILGLPVIILLRKKFYNILPNVIKNSLIEIDNRKEADTTKSYSVSLFWKQVLLFIFIVLLIIGSIDYLKKFKNNIAEKKSYTKFLGSYVCAVIAGVALFEIENL